MSRDWCERCYGKDDERFELDQHGRCGRCDKGAIDNDALRAEIAELRQRIERLERKRKKKRVAARDGIEPSSRG